MIANALMGVHRALIDYVRQQTLAGADSQSVARGLRRQGRRAVNRLEDGLATYAVKKGGAAS